MATKANNTTANAQGAAASAAAPLPDPIEGGSYTRQPDGTLVRNEPPADRSAPPADEPAAA